MILLHRKKLQSRPNSSLQSTNRAGWLAGWPARPDPCLPGATTAGGGGTGPRDAASRARRAGWLAGWPARPDPCPAPQRRAGAALAREMLPALRAAPHYSAAHVRRLHARARPHFCRPGGALTGRAALAWTQTPAVPGSARRVRLAPNPEPADRSPGQYGKARRAPCRAGRLVALLLAALGMESSKKPH